MSRAGYVLVGGRSSRMGCDKALLTYRGGPLAAYVARAVQAAAGAVTLVGDPDRYRRLGFPVIPDASCAEGPLGGILTALGHTSAEWNLVTACDMPELTSGFLAGLIEAAEASDADAVVPAGPSGLLEPLCAVYQRRALTALSDAFQRGVRKVTDALKDVRVVVARFPEVRHFRNLNTPEEWAAYAR